MKRSSLRHAIAAACAVALAACSNSSPAQPTGTGSGSTSGITSSVVAPRPLTPANTAQVKYGSQPVILTVANGLVTNNATATYTFEVATDAAFSNKVQVKDGVAEGTNGQTSVSLDTLAGGSDYYWHVRAQGGGTTGVFGAVFKFTVGPAILIQPPALVAPANLSTSTGWPTFTVSNASRSGPAGPITYRFDISTTSTFSTVLLTGTVAESPNATSYTPPGGTPAPAQRTLYWRVTALDAANGVSSASSSVFSFTYSDPTRAALLAAQEGVPLWPGVQPSGSGGHTNWGDGWDVRPGIVNGVSIIIPGIDELRVMDLMDRGMDPESAIGWLKANGYGTAAAHYPGVGSPLGVIGFPFDYIANNGFSWDLVVQATRG